LAVYTDVTDEQLAAFVSDYGIGAVISCKGIAEGVENSNFLIQTERESFILTIYEKRVAREDLPYFLGLMEHLARTGFPCPLPVRGKDGEALRELCGKPAAIVTFLPGLSARRIHPRHCAGLGEAMAHMHLAGESFPLHRPNNLSVAGWRPLYDATVARAHEVKPGLAEHLRAELDFLERNWPEGLPSGVIHGDLFPDNIFFQNDSLSGFIDFYFACNDAFAYEVSICLNAWCFEADGGFNVTKAQRLLAAYRRVRPFAGDELEMLPILARGSALRFLLTRLYDLLNHPPGAFVQPKDPLEYESKLRFHQGVAGPGAYGLN